MGRAIVRDPKVFLMDEPLSNLDAKLRVQMRTEIAKLHQSLGTTFIYVTHDQTEAMTLGTRIVVMKDGVIQQVDSPQNLYEKPVNLFVAGFMGSPQMNFLDAEVRVDGDDVYVTLGGAEIKLPEEKGKALKEGDYGGKTVILGVRPEDVDIADDGVFDSVVSVHELLGAEVFLYFNLDDTPMTAAVASTKGLHPGSPIRFNFDTERLHFFDKETEETICN